MAAHETIVARQSDRDLVITRRFAAPAQAVFDAWITPELLRQWWAPKSFGITFTACELDARVGGSYRFAFSHPSVDQPMVFFGHYLEVAPPTRLVWSNEETGDDGAVTTVTFADSEGVTELVMHDRYPSKDLLDTAIASGSTSGFSESFAQLDELLAVSI